MARDVGVNRLLKAADVRPADEPLARRAGRLIEGAASDATIDALVAATALTMRDGRGAKRCVVLTSDPDDLAVLLSGELHLRIVPV